MNPSARPNPLQKFLHRILMTKLISSALARVLYRLDKWLLGLSGGRHTLTEMVGLPVVELTTTGARTGRIHTMPLVALFDGEKIALIGSNFGRKNNPGWYYNLLANPECKIRINGRDHDYYARQAVGEEHEKYWKMGVSYYRGYERYKTRVAHRTIPVMVLVPAK